MTIEFNGLTFTLSGEHVDQFKEAGIRGLSFSYTDNGRKIEIVLPDDFSTMYKKKDKKNPKILNTLIKEKRLFERGSKVKQANDEFSEISNIGDINNNGDTSSSPAKKERSQLVPTFIMSLTYSKISA